MADVKRAIALGNLLKFRIVALKDRDDERIAAAADGENVPGAVWAAYNPENVIVPPAAAVQTTPAGKNLVLVLEGDQPVDAWHIQHAEISTDDSSRPCVLGSLNEEGARRMEKLTSTNRDRQLAIILDGVVITAPFIQSTLSSVVQVSGNFSENEVKFIVESLRSAHALGSLEREPSSETKVAAGSEE